MTELTGRAKGGAARAANLTPERRKEIAMKAADAKRAKAILPKASHRGELKIGDIEIPCAVLENGERILSELGVNATLGSAGGKSYRLRDAAIENNSGPMPLFLASKALQPFINEAFEGVDFAPVEYLNNGVITTGYKASILPQVCEVWLKAKDAGALQGSQLPKAKKAEILMRGLAQIGIIALVDEATGYQKDREKDALAKILEAFVAKELQPYLHTFDPEFYENMFKLRGLKYPMEGGSNKPQHRPQYFGKLTNDVIYRRLAPGVLEALKLEAKKYEKKSKLFQHLTPGIGRQGLLKHLGGVIMLMKDSKDWSEFMMRLNKNAPRYNSTLPLDLDEPDC